MNEANIRWEFGRDGDKVVSSIRKECGVDGPWTSTSTSHDVGFVGAVGSRGRI